MQKYLISLKLLFGLGLCALTVVSSPAYALSSDNSHLPSVYVPSENPMAQVEQVLEEAKQANKLALIVLGAQWCHDSRGFAKKFTSPALQDVIQKRFRTVFIDVGYYKDLRHITQRFGQAHYFATPTVLVVDPKSEQLLNGDTLQIWGMADSVPIAKYTSYFSEFDPNSVQFPQTIGAAYKAQISMFEQYQSQRLTEAYQQLVPAMLSEDKTGQVSDEFINQWGEVRGYRTQLQKDIQNLYKQARAQAPLPLTLPDYPSFSWTSK